MDTANPAQSIMAKTITIKDIELRTPAWRKRPIARQYYVRFSVGDTLRSTNSAKEANNRTSTSWDEILYFDADDRSVLLVHVYKKHRIGKDTLVGSLTNTIGEILGKLKDGGMKTLCITCSTDASSAFKVLEGTLRRDTSDGSDLSGIAIKFALAAEPRGNINEDERWRSRDYEANTVPRHYPRPWHVRFRGDSLLCPGIGFLNLLPRHRSSGTESIIENHRSHIHGLASRQETRMSNVAIEPNASEELPIDDAMNTVRSSRDVNQDAPVAVQSTTIDANRVSVDDGKQTTSIDVGSTSSELRVILNFPVDWTGQRDQPIDISTTASPHVFRFLDCNQLTQHKRLQITEHPHLFGTPYAATSYIWRGKPAELEAVPTFQVVGALTANPVSVEVLHYACLVAEMEGVNHLWLDLLCIMQSNDNDKNWQIEHMYELYTNCTLCIILPAGLQYIPRLDEETGWIHRGWTLQETLAPKRTVVVFQWTFGSGKEFFNGFVVASSGYGRSSTVTEVAPGHLAIASVKDILDACVVGFMFFFREYPGVDPNVRPLFVMQTKIFGQLSPNLLSLAAAMDNVIGVEQDVREHATWQCAMMRNTYDPVDMVFSIMGLFGVTLPVKAFAKYDRVGATIALAQKVLESGKSASWLGISFRLPPCRYLATFPIFPRTGLAEKALVRTKDGLQEMADFMDCEFPNADALQSGMPTGTMDDAGYLTFTSRYAYIVPELQQSESSSADLLVKAVDGSVWKVVESPLASPLTFAVIVGWFNEYTPGKTLALHYYWIKVMLIQEHAHGKFHIVLFGAMNQIFRKDVMRWKTRQFSIGGPDPLPQGQPRAGDESEEEGEMVEKIRDSMGFEMRRMGPEGHSYKTWKDLNGPRAAKAWSQLSLEKFYAAVDRDTRLPTDWEEKGFE